MASYVILKNLLPRYFKKSGRYRPKKPFLHDIAFLVDTFKQYLQFIKQNVFTYFKNARILCLTIRHLLFLMIPDVTNYTSAKHLKFTGTLCETYIILSQLYESFEYRFQHYNGGIDATGERVKHRAVNCEELDNLLDTVIDMYYSYE